MGRAAGINALNGAIELLLNTSLERIIVGGVDSFIDTTLFYPDIKYFFYTGNKLNTYIKKNQEIVDKFKKYTGDDIEDHIVFKTSLTRHAS